MQLGIQIASFSFGDAHSIRPRLREIAQFVDAGDFYSLWVMDHFFQLEGLGGPEHAMLEAYTTLGYFAALTERVRLGALVTGVIYRYPGLLAKIVSTLDVLAGGRAYLGIGAAWYEREALGLGIPYPPTGERFEHLEDALQIARHLFSGSREPFTGTHAVLREPINLPAPLSKPLPILVGGGGEKKTLRLVAQYADACNLFLGIGTAELHNKLNVLKAHCEAVGRDYASIEKTALGTFNYPSQSPGELIEQCRAAAALGITHIILNMPGIETLQPLEQLARQVLPEIAAL